MGSIYKRKGSSVWQAAFYVPDPINGLKKQIRRSTGESSRKERGLEKDEPETSWSPPHSTHTKPRSRARTSGGTPQTGSAVAPEMH